VITSLFIVGIVLVFLYLVGLILMSCVTSSEEAEAKAHQDIFTCPILSDLSLHYRKVYLGSLLACCLVLVGWGVGGCLEREAVMER
jgi:uncharacterized membrane protein YjgN (DUF898 family)